jgi:hypothetical protein
MLTFGSMFFEQVYRFDESAQRFRLRNWPRACWAPSRKSSSSIAR